MREKISCIYKVENIKNGKVYIGETGNFYRRKCDHIRELRSGIHENPNITEDLKYYTLNDFNIEIIEKVIDNKTERLKLETKYMNLYGGIDSGRLYNLKDLNSCNNDFSKHMSKGRKNIEAWNKGIKSNLAKTNCLNRKYTDYVLIDSLCKAYDKLHSYNKVAKQFNMQKGTVHRLITNANNFKNVTTISE